MGFNTVAVLYNDHTAEIRDSGPLGRRIAGAMQGWSARDRDRLITHFGCGMVISQAHADYAQVVIVARNHGVTAAEAENLDSYALMQMKECLERHGYKVTPPRSKKQSG